MLGHLRAPHVTPLVWIGGQCGVVTDALPGTHPGDESSCDYCGDGCTMVAADASEFDVDDPEDAVEEMTEPEEWELKLEAAYQRAAEEERVGAFGPEFLRLGGWSPTPKE